MPILFPSKGSADCRIEPIMRSPLTIQAPQMPAYRLDTDEQAFGDLAVLQPFSQQTLNLHFTGGEPALNAVQHLLHDGAQSLSVDS